MGTYEQGILGSFSGKVGTVVGANWRGKNIMRSRPRKSNKTPTEAQQLQRSKLSVVSKFLNPLKGLLREYYGQRRAFRSRVNLAMSYHLREAVVLNVDHYEMLYNKVLISKGGLQGLANPTLSPGPNIKLALNWTDNSGQGMAKPTDELVVVVYSPQLDMFEIFENVAQRDSPSVTLTVATVFMGTKVHCWASFVDDERKLAAVSQYLGEIQLT